MTQSVISLKNKRSVPNSQINVGTPYKEVLRHPTNFPFQFFFNFAFIRAHDEELSLLRQIVAISI